MSSVSVIIPTYNLKLLIERALLSVIHQNGGHEIEIIIVDDCSTDETLSIIESLYCPFVKIIRQKRNQGPAAARNHGLAIAEGDFCAFLDGDDFWEPDFLNETTAFLKSHQEAVAVSVMQCHKTFNGKVSIVPPQPPIQQPVLLDDFFDFWAKYNHVCTGSVLIRTSVAKATGGQREDFRVCEDLEFWALLATYGKWGFIPKVLFTSDGGLVTKKNGWLAKARKRWASAVPIDIWSQRIVQRLSEKQKESFPRAQARIARNLAYSMIMDGRYELARQDVLKCSFLFPKNRLNSIFTICSRSRCIWFFFTSLLRCREYIRGITV
ncbi:MAG: glycosyltransferase family 2 protein [Victivallales bacterium]|nr:glycosyltransferase family 2 protein [Victivallales bacterium]